MGDRHSFILENRGINIVKMDESHYKKENGKYGSIKFSEMQNLNKESVKDVQNQIWTVSPVGARADRRLSPHRSP